MNYHEFLMWLEAERKMSARSARDVVSRLKRVIYLLDGDAVDSTSVSKLNKITEFHECTVFVKSQLRRSIRLYLEYSNK